MGGKKSSKSSFGILKETFSDFMEDRALRLSAAMAYYAVFSLGPLLFLVIGVAGLLLGEERVHKEVSEQLQSLLGGQSAGMLDSMMTARRTGGSTLATVIGIVGLLLGASGVFGQLQDSLNTIWEVKPKPGGGIWGFLRNRFLSMGMVLGIGFLLLISMVLTTVVNAASGQISNLIGMSEAVAQGLNMVAAFAVITVLFAAIFKFLPDVKIKWSDVWVGAVGTALLFTAGKFVLGWYLGRESTTSGYGAAGAFIVILLYIYYSSVILFFGAEFTQVYARYRGSRIVPSEHAEPVTEEARAQQGMPGRGGSGRRQAGGRRAPAPAYAHAHAMGYSGEHAISGVHSGGGSSQATHKKSKFMRSTMHSDSPHMYGTAPLEQVRARPYSFVGLAVAAAVAAGLLLKFRTLRKGVKWYLAGRHLLGTARRTLRAHHAK